MNLVTEDGHEDPNFTREIDGNCYSFRCRDRSNDNVGGGADGGGDRGAESEDVVLQELSVSAVERELTFNELDEETQAALQRVIGEDGETYQCKICSLSDLNLQVTFQHIMNIHGDTWREFTGLHDAGTSAAGTSNDAGTSAAGTSRGVHLNPNWKRDLKETFMTEVIPKLSQKSRMAFTTNENIKDKQLFKVVRTEITSEFQDHVLSFFGTVKMPSESVLRELISDVLVANYPYMFGTDESSSAFADKNLNYGRNLGGILGATNLPAQTWNAIYKKRMRMIEAQIGSPLTAQNQEGVDTEEAGVEAAAGGSNNRSRGKKKPEMRGKLIFTIVYGVSQEV